MNVKLLNREIYFFRVRNTVCVEVKRATNKRTGLRTKTKKKKYFKFVIFDKKNYFLFTVFRYIHHLNTIFMR